RSASASRASEAEPSPVAGSEPPEPPAEAPPRPPDAPPAPDVLVATRFDAPAAPVMLDDPTVDVVLDDPIVPLDDDPIVVPPSAGASPEPNSSPPHAPRASASAQPRSTPSLMNQILCEGSPVSRSFGRPTIDYIVGLRDGASSKERWRS